MTITEKAQWIKEKGSKLPIDEIIAMLEKSEAGKAKRAKRSAKKFAARERAETFVFEKRNWNDVCLESARNQRPSSMR